MRLKTRFTSQGTKDHSPCRSPTVCACLNRGCERPATKDEGVRHNLPRTSHRFIGGRAPRTIFGFSPTDPLDRVLRLAHSFTLGSRTSREKVGWVPRPISAAALSAVELEEVPGNALIQERMDRGSPPLPKSWVTVAI